MLSALSRITWIKRARAVFAERVTNKSGRMTAFKYAVRLYGPTDGSGCRPAGESITKTTGWRSSKQKAIAEAVAYCDERKIKIREFPAGFSY